MDVLKKHGITRKETKCQICYSEMLGKIADVNNKEERYEILNDFFILLQEIIVRETKIEILKEWRHFNKPIFKCLTCNKITGSLKRSIKHADIYHNGKHNFDKMPTMYRRYEGYIIGWECTTPVREDDVLQVRINGVLKSEVPALLVYRSKGHTHFFDPTYDSIKIENSITELLFNGKPITPNDKIKPIMYYKNW